MKTINASPLEEKNLNLSTKEWLIILGTIFISCAALVALYKFNNPQLSGLANKNLKEAIDKGKDSLKSYKNKANISPKTFSYLSDVGKKKLREILIQCKSKERCLWTSKNGRDYFWSDSLNQVYTGTSFGKRF